MSRIDRIRRATLTGGAYPAANDRANEAAEPKAAALPAVIPASKTPPGGDPDSAAVFAAQLMGQDGQKRGLRAGPLHIDMARGAYNKVEWSGARDRRARSGRNARTEV